MTSEVPNKSSNLPLLAVIGGVLLVMTILFGFRATRSHGEYDKYEHSTLEDAQNPPAWEKSELSVEACVDEAIAWGMECPGVQSWCLAKLPEVTAACLQSQDRDEYCVEVGTAVMTTRFGFPECESRLEAYDGPDSKYARRAAKKYCALAYRAIAGHCQRATDKMSD